jgi:hypothetical protein
MPNLMPEIDHGAIEPAKAGAVGYATRMQKRFGWVHLMGATVLGLVLGVGLMTIRLTESFDECMISQMRGVPRSMHTTAYNICTERNPAP